MNSAVAVDPLRRVVSAQWCGTRVVLFDPDDDLIADCDEEEVGIDRASSTGNLKSSGEPEIVVTKEETKVVTPHKSPTPASLGEAEASSAAPVLSDNAASKWCHRGSLREEVPPIDELLSWGFDALSYDKEYLVPVVLIIFGQYDLLERFEIDGDVMTACATEIMNMHAECSYHNWYHAVSAMHQAFLLLKIGGADRYIHDDQERLALLLGALIHDLDHTGFNNDFEVKSKSELAQTYAGVSVLENHSISATFNLLSKPEMDIFNNLSDDDRSCVIYFMKEVILATDPAHHSALTKELSDLVQSCRYSQTFESSDPDSRLLLGKVIMHASDISNPVHENFIVAKDWCARVTAEFSYQAEMEKAQGLPVTPFMEGLDTEYKVAKLQIGFFQFMVQPLFKLLGVLLPDTAHLERNGVRNSEQYQKIVDSYEK